MNVLDTICVIRFGALGDLCICGWFISELAATRPDSRITLVTKPEFIPLAQAFRGVHEVLTPRSGSLGDLIHFAEDLRRRKFDRVIDAHSVLRSTLLWIAWRRLPEARLQKDTLARLLLIAGGRLGIDPRAARLKPRLLDRFRALDPVLGKQRETTPALAPLLELRAGAPGGDPRIGMAPGARWPLKMWPAEKYRDLCRSLLEATPASIEIFLGPRERETFNDGPLAELAAAESRVRLCVDQPLPEVAGRLASCRCLVTNDSGLLHLAEAAGTPVVALFGPTTRDFGYFPLLGDSRVLEIDLPCRPCSRTGGGGCHRGDHACLQDLPVADVLEAVLDRIRDSRETIR